MKLKLKEQPEHSLRTKIIVMILAITAIIYTAHKTHSQETDNKPVSYKGCSSQNN